MKIIKISDFYLSQIKSALAYPVAPRIHLTDDEIKVYAVWEAMYQYYLKFPIPKYEQRIQMASPTVIPFPNDDTIGLLDVRITDKYNDSNSGGSFLNLYHYNKNYSKYRTRILNTRRPGGSGTFNPNGLQHLQYQERQFADAVNNNQNTFKQIIDPYEKTLTVHSTIHAKVDIVWAQTSVDFDRIKPVQLLNVIELARCNLRLHLASLGGMLVDSNAEKQINVDYLTNESKEKKEKIIEGWMMSPDAVSIRMT